MRAARLLEMLLVLQRQGRSTARQLAETFEVSERTVLRDVEALSEAGVPVFATRGPKGGIELLDGFQTNLSGFTREESESLLLAGQPRLAHRLGLAQPARAVHNKLLDALDHESASSAEGLHQWFLNDPDPWAGNKIPHGELRRIASCIRRRRAIELTFGDLEETRTIEPLGLVLKAGSWFAIRTGSPAPTTVSLERLRSTRITKLSFEPPSDFELADFWDRHLSTITEVEKG